MRLHGRCGGVCFGLRSYIRRNPPFFKRAAGQHEESKMTEPSRKSCRKPRSDAVRNRERVLEAAKAVFSAGGADASLEAVARRAGVGIGTLYRHFPTREALYRGGLSARGRTARRACRTAEGRAEPVDALRRWLRSTVEFVATKKGMLAALALAAHGNRSSTSIRSIA